MRLRGAILGTVFPFIVRERFAFRRWLFEPLPEAAIACVASGREIGLVGQRVRLRKNLIQIAAFRQQRPKFAGIEADRPWHPTTCGCNQKHKVARSCVPYWDALCVLRTRPLGEEGPVWGIGRWCACRRSGLRLAGFIFPGIAMAIVLGLALAVSPAAAEIQIGVYGGWSESFDSDIHLGQPAAPISR